METLVTIATFDTIHQLGLVKARLESEGIECFVLDEHIGQTGYFINAIGGIKLRVKKSDLPNAVNILKESGVISESSNGLSPSERKSFIARIRNLSPLSFFLFSGALAASIILLIYFLNRPTLEEQITGKDWYVKTIIKNGKSIQPKSIGVRMFEVDGSPIEYFLIENSGDISLPGINTYQVNAKWKISEDHLTIYDADTLQEIYEGHYAIELGYDYLLLRSESVVLSGTTHN